MKMRSNRVWMVAVFTFLAATQVFAQSGAQGGRDFDDRDRGGHEEGRDRRPDRPTPIPMPPEYPPGRPDFPGATQDFVSRYVGQRFVGSNVLHLRQLLDLGPEFRGRKIEYVKLTASTEHGNGDAQLMINGFAVGMAQNVGRRMDDVIFYPDHRDTIGEETQGIQIALRGNFEVQSVAIKLRPEFGRDRDVIEVPLNQFVRGQTTLPVRELLNIGSRFRGRTIEAVILVASSQRGNARAELLVDGRPTGAVQRIDAMTETLTFFLDAYRDRVDVDFSRLELAIQGNVSLMRLGARFRDGVPPSVPPGDRPAPIPHPIPGPGVPGPGYPGGAPSAAINQSFTGYTTLQLSHYIFLGGVSDLSEIDSVTIVASSDFNGQASLLVSGREVGMSETFGRRLESHTFSIPGRFLARNLNQLAISLRGDFFVQSLAVNLKGRF